MMYYLTLVLAIIWTLLGIGMFGNAVKDKTFSSFAGLVAMAVTAFLLFSYAEVLRG